MLSGTKKSVLPDCPPPSLTDSRIMNNFEQLIKPHIMPGLNLLDLPQLAYHPNCTIEHPNLFFAILLCFCFICVVIVALHFSNKPPLNFKLWQMKTSTKLLTKVCYECLLEEVYYKITKITFYLNSKYNLTCFMETESVISFFVVAIIPTLHFMLILFYFTYTWTTIQISFAVVWMLALKKGHYKTFKCFY